MIISITPKSQLALKTNIGQYNVLKNRLDIWINSASLILGEEYITIPDFNIPDKVDAIYITDTDKVNTEFVVPTNEFKEYHIDNVGYKFKYSELVNKYKRTGVPNQVL